MLAGARDEVTDGRDTLYAVFTMDCLPASGTAEVRGPLRWDDAARHSAAFAAALAAEGFGGTLFFAPEGLMRLRSAVNEAQGAGCEIGLLCHPQLSSYQSYLGAYNFDRQREIVSRCRKLWEDALGDAPATFRPGFFSANDYTYHVLCMEGFRQGSCSLPGRVDGEQCSMWFGCYPFAHHTDPLDRTAQGTMEFFEVPVTSDLDAAAYVNYETYTPPHLRIEEADVQAYARDVITKQLDKMDEDEVAARTVSFVTSNLVEWGKANDPHADRLRNLCAMLREIAEVRRLDLSWRPLSALHEEFDREFSPT